MNDSWVEKFRPKKLIEISNNDRRVTYVEQNKKKEIQIWHTITIKLKEI